MPPFAEKIFIEQNFPPFRIFFYFNILIKQKEEKASGTFSSFPQWEAQQFPTAP